MAELQIYEVIHTSPELKTVYDFISDSDSLAFNYVQNPESFLNVKDSKGRTNRESIENTYNTNAERKLKGKSSKELILKLGTRLAIEAQKVNKAGLLTEGLEITDYNIPAFKAKALANLEANEKYKTFNKSKASGKYTLKGSVMQSMPDITVWVWCRALANKSNNYEGEILNLTPFITNKLTTDMNRDGGGAFEFSLPPLICRLDNDGKWVIKKNHIQFYQGKNSSNQKTDYAAQGSLYENVNNELKRNSFFFHNILSPQDLVFIRFETLEMESDQRVVDNEQLNISKSSIPNRIYDMIGLIDQNGIQIQPSNTDVTINVSGRDLAKLFIEDGAYVFDLEMSRGMLGGPGSTAANGLSKRLIADKSLQYLSLYFNNSIEKVIKFVFSQLTNITVVPDNLFSSYIDENGKDRRNQRFVNDSDQSSKSNDDKSLYSKNAKSIIAELRKTNGLYKANVSLEQEKINVNNVYNEMYRFLKEIRVKKVRTIEDNETIGWSEFIYKNNRGSLEKIVLDSFPDYFNETLYQLEETTVVDGIKPIVVNIDSLLDIEESTSQYASPIKKEVLPGIWQIIKLALDSNITGRKIIDSSLSTANGSLVNFFNKVCQKPFIEMIMDTYGDMYYLTVRKPPTDRSGIVSLLESQVVVENESSVTSSIAGIVDIQDEDVLFEQLSFSDDEAYSWYHLQPQANFLGGDEFSLAYLPAIFLPEYAEIWGSRPMQLQHNYLPTVYKDTDQNSLDIIQKQAVEDLRYIIESSAYLPFVRKGIIKTNGDRRYKVGNLIRYKPTGEIFHIDHVKHEFETEDNKIDYASSIMVSRGMVEQLIYGVPSRNASSGESSYISYFNLVETKPEYDYEQITTYREETVKTGKKKVGETANPLIINSSIFSPELTINLASANQGIELLYEYPTSTRGIFVEFIRQINSLGYKVIIAPGMGVRTYSQQLALFQKRDKKHPAAAPGSKHGHEAGRAIDINVVKGNVTLVKFSPKIQWLQSGIVGVAEKLNLEWGGYYDDNNHFQLKKGELQNTPIYEDTYETKRIPEKQQSLNIGKIFSNFKVNKEVFNFFLKREQLNAIYITVKDKGIYNDQGIKTLSEVIVKSK